MIFMSTKMLKKMTRITDGKYQLKAQMPDRMGTYMFKLRLRRPGYSLLQFEDSLFVRPWHYKENVKNWDRDSVAAGGVIAIFLGFAFVSII